MKRPKRFLTLILILLVINTLFFAAWYGFDLKGKLTDIGIAELGKALGGKADLKEISIGEKQILAKGLSFTASDSSLVFDVEQIRIRYNLLRLIFSGFRMKNLLDRVEIVNPVVAVRILPKVREPKYKPKQEFKLPDVSKFFRQVEIKNGKFSFAGEFPLKIITSGNMSLAENLSNIDISVVNNRQTNLRISANSSSGGIIKGTASLDKGRIASASLEVSNLSPKYASHPDVKDLTTELNLALTASQATVDAPIRYEAQAFIWNTQTFFMDRYPVSMPYLSATTDGDELIVDLATATFGTSSFSANANLSQLTGDPQISATARLEAIDLSMADPSLQGIVRAEVTAEGSLKDPLIGLNAGSDRISYGNISISDVVLDADYAENMLSYDLSRARWENQTFSTAGVADLSARQLSGSLSTLPIELYGEEIVASGKIDYTAALYEKLPEVSVVLDNVSFVYGLLEVTGINGGATLIPSTDQEGKQSYFVNSAFTSTQGYDLVLIGDILDKNLLLDMNFHAVSLADVYALQVFTDLEPSVNGSLKAIMSNGSVSARSDLNVAMGKSFSYHSDLRVLGNYELDTGNAALHIDGSNGVFNDEPLDVQLSAQKQGNILAINSLRIRDLLSLSGKTDITNLRDLTFDLALTEVSSQTIRQFYPDIELGIPEFSGLSVVANYSDDPERFLDARINLREFLVEGIYPLSAKLRLIGPPKECLLTGDISSSSRNLIRLTGEADIDDKIQLSARARVEDLSPDDIIFDSPVKGTVSGVVSAEYTDLMGMLTHPVLGVDLKVSDLTASGIEVDAIELKARQTDKALIVETLTANKLDQFDLSGSGSLDYNILTNEFSEGNGKLDLVVEGELFRWLDGLVDYITDAKGNSRLSCSIGTIDEQLTVSEGSLTITDGMLRLKDQSEHIEDINITGIFDQNRFILDNASIKIGNGKILLTNNFREDISNHFRVGFLDLGVFELKIDDPGILVNVPLFSPPRSLSNISLKGQGGEYATIMGPFDNMKIKAHATISNAAVLYPPNTENLLNLIYTVRNATKSAPPEPAPMPFTLDLLITLQENVSFVTYPTNFQINPGSFLHLKYDGNIWSLSEANFTSESGTIDFFGTVFDNQQLSIFILESREIMNISGDFVRRAPDGTTVTLRVVTDKDTSKSIFNRLQFSLTSDNPDDQSITSMLSSLRYSDSGSGSDDPLSDEALNLIGGNLNKSLLTPILYPIENSIRRFLRLDTFSIQVGFIQNLFTEYSADPDKLADYTDMRQFNNDIMQFSSSILLNNLSLSMSKYLGRRLFLDYKLSLQEATDLQRNTIVEIAHDTSLRWMLPYKLRLSYNLKYEPEDSSFTHGIMLKRAFIFYGF